MTTVAELADLVGGELIDFHEGQMLEELLPPIERQALKGTLYGAKELRDGVSVLGFVLTHVERDEVQPESFCRAPQ